MAEKMNKNSAGFVIVRGARENNLKNISVDIPRNVTVVFTGISGSGKSSLAFSTLYAEAQRRYLESVSPYARRLFNQMNVPDVDSIEGLPPAVALQQQRGTVSTRSTVGSVTTISNLLRMLYSRAGDYPKGLPIIYAEGFSPNTTQGACPECHGMGKVYEATEQTMVPDNTLTIRERAIAAWPTAWQGQNLREILITLGYDVDVPWYQLPKKVRDWILFTEEQPVVPVYSGWESAQVKDAIKRKLEPSYMGTFTSARRYVLQTFSNSTSALMRKRASKFMIAAGCPACHGKKLKKEALSVSFANYDITEMSALSFSDLFKLSHKVMNASDPDKVHPEKALVVRNIMTDLRARLEALIDLGLGYLSPDRATPTLSPGELQRLRLATQIRSSLFGVIYVLDEPSAGLHPADTTALMGALDQLKRNGNSLFIVEHEPEVIRKADWIIDVGPGAGKDGGKIVFSGAMKEFEHAENSITSQYLFNSGYTGNKHRRTPSSWITLKRITRNNISNLNVKIPLGLLTTVTGISGSGKSSLVSQALVQLVSNSLGSSHQQDNEEKNLLVDEESTPIIGTVEGAEKIKKIIVVDQKAIGRTPRSNLATYTGLFDHIRKIFANTKMAKSRHYDVGWFSFNMPKGSCNNCKGEGFVMVELLFLPSVYTPCPVCKGSRYNDKTLEILYAGRNIAEVLEMTVNEAYEFFTENTSVIRSLDILKKVGLGYLKLGQPATELSGGEAQRIKLATELQRVSTGDMLYVLDEPTTGLHPADTERLLQQIQTLTNAGNTVVVVEHDMRVIAASDWVIDMGPGAGGGGGKIVAQGTPETVSEKKNSVTGKFLKIYLEKAPE